MNSSSFRSIGSLPTTCLNSHRRAGVERVVVLFSLQPLTLRPLETGWTYVGERLCSLCSDTNLHIPQPSHVRLMPTNSSSASGFSRSDPLTPAEVGAGTWWRHLIQAARCSIGNHPVLKFSELGQTW